MDVIEPIGSSDHNMVRYEIFWQCKPALSSTKVFNFRKANFDQMRLSLLNIDWAVLLSNGSAENMWVKFKRIILSMHDKHIPKVMKAKLNRKSPLWMNRSIRKGLFIKKIILAI